MSGSASTRESLAQPGFLPEILLTLAATLLTAVSGSLLLILLLFIWSPAGPA